MEIFDNFSKKEDLFEYIAFMNGHQAQSHENEAKKKERFESLQTRISQSSNQVIKNYISLNMTSDTLNLKQFLEEIEKKTILFALKLTFNNQRKAATLLGIKPTTLGEKLKKFKQNSPLN